MASVTLESNHQTGMWIAVFRLLRLRLRLWVNTFRKAKLVRKIFSILFFLLILAFGGGLAVGSFFLLRLLQSPQLAAYVDITPILNALPTLILTAGFIVILATNFSVLLQGLYLSRDMDFLIAAPIPMRAVFLSKMILAILPNFGLFCLAGLPILFGLAGSLRFNPIFYVVAVVQAAMLALAAGGLASILVMLVVRVFPAKRVAEVIGFIGAIVTITLSQMGNLMNSVNVNETQIANIFSKSTILNEIWFPLAWVGRGMIDMGRGAWGSGLALTALSLVLSSAIFVVSLVVSEKLYYSGWARMQGNAQKKKAAPRVNGAQRTKPQATTWAGISIFPRITQAIIRKDFMLLRRDLRNLSHFISPLIIGLVMVFSTNNGIRSAGNYSSFMEKLPNMAQYINVGVTFLVSWMLLSNLATSSFSREGRNYWLLRAAPLKPNQVIMGKFVVSYLPGLAIGWLFLLVSTLFRGTVPLSDLAFDMLIVAVLLFGMNGLLLSFGIAGAKLDWVDVRRQGLQGGAGCASIVAAFAFGIITYGLFFAPPVLASFFLPAEWGWVSKALGVLLGTACSLLVAFISLGITSKRVLLIGEEK